MHSNLADRWFCRLGLEHEIPNHSTFSNNRHSRFRESDTLKLKEKVRIGSRMVKRDHPPQTPYARLLGSGVLSEAVRVRLRDVSDALDPLELLEQIRRTQEQLALLSQGKRVSASGP